MRLRTKGRRPAEQAGRLHHRGRVDTFAVLYRPHIADLVAEYTLGLPQT
ncbi:hypothetical protein ACWEGX_03075 [Streptomyces chartreusis]|nr:hypothetical protein POD33_10780 [Streptomyces moderatus]